MTAAATKPETTDVEGLRRTLIFNGYTPVPVLTGDKMPLVLGWAKLQPDEGEVSALLTAHPDHMSTGLLTGKLVAIDIDVMDEAVVKEIETLVAALPDAHQALSRVGQAPKILYLFRTDEPQSKALTPEYDVAGKKAQVEVMGLGQQIVAFGTHPVTGVDYEWIGDSPFETTLAELPLIDRGAIAQFLIDAEAVLAKHGSPKKKNKGSLTRPTQEIGATPWMKVNTAALQNIECWVSAVFPSAKQEEGTGAWRVTSAQLGRPLQEDISIHADGIRDFGEEIGETPLSLVQKWGSASSVKEAAYWLCERLGVEPAAFGFGVFPGATASILKKYDLVAANDNDDAVGRTLKAARLTSGLPEEMCYPPGAVGDFARFITSCARFPSPQLALVASLAFTSALIGRRYKGPTGLRSNIYIVGLANSGVGKDITIRVPMRIADATSGGGDVSKSLVIDKPSSFQGLAKALSRSPASYTVIDEFGHWLDKHTGKNAPAHREEIIAALMELTGASEGVWGGQERATGNVPRIIQPCLSIHGVSTPSTFWNALSSGNISEGLLGRLILIEAGTSHPKKVRRPAGSMDDIPTELVDQVHALLGGGGARWNGGPFYALNAKPDSAPFPVMTVEYGPGAEDEFEDFDDEIRSREKKYDEAYLPILFRVGANALKLAMIVAVGIDHKNPVITVEVQRWANSVAEASFHTMVRGADDNIADNDRSKEYLRVRDFIGREKGEGITLRILTRRLRGGIDKRRFEDILHGLRTAGEAHFAKRKTPSGQWAARFWKAEYLPEDAEIIPIE